MRRRTCITRLRSAALAVLVAVLANGAALADSKDATKRLFEAVVNNDMDAAQLSVAAGADPNAKNARGKTAVDIAIDRGHFDIAHFLLSMRAVRPKPSSDAGASNRAVSASPLPARRTATPSTTSPEPPRPKTPTKAWPAGKPNPFDPNYIPDAMAAPARAAPPGATSSAPTTVVPPAPPPVPAQAKKPKAKKDIFGTVKSWLNVDDPAPAKKREKWLPKSSGQDKKWLPQPSKRETPWRPQAPGAKPAPAPAPERSAPAQPPPPPRSILRAPLSTSKNRFTLAHSRK